MDIQESQPEVDHIKPARFGEERAAVLHPRGVLDHSSFQALVETARAEIRRGARRLIVDLAGVYDMSCLSGVAGLYIIATLLEGKPVEDFDGWALVKEMSKALEQERVFTRLILAAPTEQVAHVLRITGFDRLVRTLSTMDNAVSV